jgi:hypothetical protein
MPARAMLLVAAFVDAGQADGTLATQETGRVSAGNTYADHDLTKQIVLKVSVGNLARRADEVERTIVEGRAT